jgi:drug/metabolite transporter (DMT)-like permease
VALWLFLDRQPISRITFLRLILILPGVYLLVSNAQKNIDFLGAGMMVAAALLYALHLLINQRILYEAPAPTVTFYTLLSMSVTVTIAFFIFNPALPPAGTPWWPLLSLALITFLSRIALFQGVKQLGGMQTSILGLGELLVTVVFARILLHETLEVTQWIGAILIGLNMLLVAYDKPTTVKRAGKGFLFWLNPPSISPNDYPFHN